MGSFVGHIDEAIFFMLLAAWWMFNAFPRYIKSEENRQEYRCYLSYSFRCGRYSIPVEAVLKTLFPLGGFLGEMWSEGLPVLDEEGNFRKLVEMQHMSIYGIFVLHGVIDIMTSLRVPLPRGSDYLTIALCFMWYGLSFSYHAHMEEKEPVETMIHALPVYIMYACAICSLLELWKPDSFLAQVSRTFCLLFLGTWFAHASFIMYDVHQSFPGSALNPAWDQTDMRNVNFIVALFGYHLSLNLIIMVVTYLVTYYVMKCKLGRRRFETNHEERAMLLKDDLLFKDDNEKLDS